jgi:phage repressor protein C with HTH and peptisase S24 domain
MEPTNQEIGAALREILSDTGKTQRAIADAMGVTQSSVSKILRGEFPFDADRLKRVSRALGYSRERLERELRAIIARRPLSLRVASASMQETTAPLGVPLLAPVAAGASNHTAEIDAPRSTLPITTRAVGDEHAFALEVVGDSMSPLFDEGDIVVCSPRAHWSDGDPCFIEMRDRSDTIKAVYRLGDGRVELRPLNARRHRPRVESDDQDTGRIARIVRVVGRYTPLNGRHR